LLYSQEVIEISKLEETSPGMFKSLAFFVPGLCDHVKQPKFYQPVGKKLRLAVSHSKILQSKN
jgi:hypothetical protein